MSNKGRDDKLERKRHYEAQARLEAIKIARLKGKQEDEARSYEDTLVSRQKKHEVKSLPKKE